MRCALLLLSLMLCSQTGDSVLEDFACLSKVARTYINKKVKALVGYVCSPIPFSFLVFCHPPAYAFVTMITLQKHMRTTTRD